MGKTLGFPYDPPVLSEQPLETLGGAGPMPIRSPVLDAVDGVGCDELAERFGSPQYIISEGSLREAYRSWIAPFRAGYPRTTIAYSYKTNYLSAVCAILHQEGALAEVTSAFERSIASALGVPGPQTVFNGRLKRTADLESAFADGCRVNVDSRAELARVEDIAARSRVRVPIGLRVHAHVGELVWDGFGFSLESGEAFAACEEVARHPGVQLAGLHMHCGTSLLNPDVHHLAMRRLVDLALAIKRTLGIEVEYLDIGGGYASVNRLRGQWLPGAATAPSPIRYAEAIVTPLVASISAFDQPPELILEPGRVLVDRCMSLLTTVDSTRTLTSGRKAAVVDAGVNLLPTAYWYEHEVLPTCASDRTCEWVTLLGPLCMMVDVVCHDALLPSPLPGDRYIIRNVGAYNFSQSMQFIQPRPAVVLISDGVARLIRERETYEYLTELETLPAHLERASGDDGKPTSSWSAA